MKYVTCFVCKRTVPVCVTVQIATPKGGTARACGKHKGSKRIEAKDIDKLDLSNLFS